MMPMANDEIAKATDPVKRARLELMRDIINELDTATSDARARVAPRARAGAGAEALMSDFQAAIAEERVKGLVAATELVVRKFRDEADAAPEQANDAPAGETNGQGGRHQVEQLPDV